MSDIKGEWKRFGFIDTVATVIETTVDHVIYRYPGMDVVVRTREDFLVNFRPVTTAIEIGDVVLPPNRDADPCVVGANIDLNTLSAYGNGWLPTGDKLPVLDESRWYLVGCDGLAFWVGHRAVAEESLAEFPVTYVAIATIRGGRFVSPYTDADGVEHLLPLASQDRNGQ